MSKIYRKKSFAREILTCMIDVIVDFDELLAYQAPKLGTTFLIHNN